MSKYAALGSFLRAQPADRVPMTFKEIEALIGDQLPRSKRYPAWWSNHPGNNPMTRVWLDAGFRTEGVDIDSKRLTFRRAEQSPPVRPSKLGENVAPVAETTREGFDVEPGYLERLRARMAGTVLIAPGVDLCEPTGEVWDAEL